MRKMSAKEGNGIAVSVVCTENDADVTKTSDVKMWAMEGFGNNGAEDAIPKLESIANDTSMDNYSTDLKNMAQEIPGNDTILLPIISR